MRWLSFWLLLMLVPGHAEVARSGEQPAPRVLWRADHPASDLVMGADGLLSYLEYDDEDTATAIVQLDPAMGKQRHRLAGDWTDAPRVGPDGELYIHTTKQLVQIHDGQLKVLLEDDFPNTEHPDSMVLLLDGGRTLRYAGYGTSMVDAHGKERWGWEGPAVGEGGWATFSVDQAEPVVYMELADYYFVAVNLDNGQELWHMRSERLDHRAIPGGGALALRGSRARRLAPQGGHELWVYDAGEKIYSARVGQNGVLLRGSIHFHCLDAEGGLKWRYRAPSAQETGPFMEWTVGPDGSGYFGAPVKDAETHLLTAIGPAGQLKWQLPVDDVQRLLAAEGRLYAVTDEGVLALADP
jgi:hypothetical protein